MAEEGTYNTEGRRYHTGSSDKARLQLASKVGPGIVHAFGWPPNVHTTGFGDLTRR